MSNLSETEPLIVQAVASTSITITTEQFDKLLNRSEKSNGIANPAALGLAAFALTTFILSAFNAGDYFIDIRLEPVVLPVALFYGGLAQFLAGMWECKLNNTFGATAFIAWYGCAAVVINSAFKRLVLPLGVYV
ncbi:hypothetical protein I4U23_016329 [Adineta vaga]|nr:hypothetical protein I4U23_016329 [Adineta vaga]